MPNSLREVFENTIHKAKLVAGICNSPNLEQVKDLLEHGAQLTNKAKTTADFANSVQMLGKAGDRLAGAADAIDKIVDKGAQVAGDVSAGCEISDAISVLNDWTSPGSKVSNQDAAKAFDQLFGGASRYMAKLPFPANSYAKLLAAIKEYSFFANMQRTMDFANDPNNPEGGQLLRLEREGYQ